MPIVSGQEEENIPLGDQRYDALCHTVALCAIRRRGTGQRTETSTNTDVLAAANLVPKGFYAKWEMDVGGARGCSSLCWEYFYFINDKQVATTFPDGGIDALNCSKDKCLTYQIKGNKLTLSNKFIKYTPSTGLKLQGKYESFNSLSHL
ncbi:hypothetical protein ACFYU8_25110 [Brevibacillus sp. NPDC003359]|uniref:hypothetical protein n=1 Tax=unclassified Brevibacillus TaxID=2684853 RepID=UPI0036BC2729